MGQTDGWGDFGSRGGGVPVFLGLLILHKSGHEKQNCGGSRSRGPGQPEMEPGFRAEGEGEGTSLLATPDWNHSGALLPINIQKFLERKRLLWMLAGTD